MILNIVGVPKSQSTDELEQGVQDYIKDKEETQELQQPLDSSRAGRFPYREQFVIF